MIKTRISVALMFASIFIFCTQLMINPAIENMKKSNAQAAAHTYSTQGQFDD